MADSDKFMADGNVPAQGLSDIFELDERQTPFEEEDYSQEVTEYKLPDPTPATPGSGKFSPLGTPAPRRTISLTLNPNSSNNFRPSVFNPANGPPVPAHRSSFTLPVTNIPTAQPAQSIFGPTKTSVNESLIKAEEADDLPRTPIAPTSPYRELIESQSTASQFVPQSEEISFTSDRRNKIALRQTPALEEHSNQQASIEIDSDSDNDDDGFEIIESSNASEAAQARWQEFRPSIIPATPQTPFTRIKEEHNNVNDEPIASHIPIKIPIRSQRANTALSSTPDMEDILASQRALLNKNKVTAKTSRKSGENLLSPSPTFAKKRGFEGRIVAEDPEQVEAAMRAGIHDDESWMHEEPEDMAAAEMEILKEKISVLGRKEANGKINEIETLQLLQLRKYWRLQEKLKHAAKGNGGREPEEQDLFVPSDFDWKEMLKCKREELKLREKRGVTPDMDREGDDDDDGGDESSSHGYASEENFSGMLREKPGGVGLDGVPAPFTKTKKPRKKVARDAREFFYRQDEERRAKERARAQKAKAKVRKGVKGGRKSLSRGKAATGRKGKSAAKGKPAAGSSNSLYENFNMNDGFDEVGQMIINDLMNNDPISERLQNPIFDVEPEPDMPGRQNKQTQLQRLLANIPEGSNGREARSDRARLQEASRSFGFAKVKAVDGKWLIKGMRSTLYHHQLLGAQWMIKRELSDGPPLGGLLADGMGLGKTVQTLACMVGNPPGEKYRNRGVKATLIVVPSSVIDQWMGEIRTHADAQQFPKIMRYKNASKISVEILRDVDIVVTSYQEVMGHFPSPDAKDRERIAKIGYEKWWKKAEKNMGDLFGVNWYRVVLDEAHAIKNNAARTSLACQNLKSVFRWCLTGTPLLNRLEELFPYMRFLKANYSMDWKVFQKYFCDSQANDCNTRISTLLSFTMMRRTMKTTILNRPIITLPKPHPEIRFVEFSPEERLIYRITENRFRANLNVYLANRTATKNYAVFLVQLLRLRQCTSHPFMLEKTIKECWTSSDLKELKDRLNMLAKVNVSFYKQCNVWIEQTEEEREAATARGENFEQNGISSGEIMRFGISDFGHSFEMNKALKTLKEEDVYSRITCALCSDIPHSPMLTDCNHIFCKECLSSYMHRQAALNEEDYLICPVCDKIFSSFKPFRGLADGDEDMQSESQDGTSSGSQGSRSKKRKNQHASAGKGADALGYEPMIKDSTWVDKTDNDSFPLVPSAKMVALKALLLKGFHAAPTDKVIIYVQFRLLAKIIGRICHSEGWGFLYLTGECSLEHRSNVVKNFREDDDIQILIAGLKCGGLGLNFPWANRCFSLDLWWNHAVEQQAFGRIFRIGQKKETYMTRIVVKNTIDMRLLSMQQYKLKACDSAVDSGEEKKSSLTLKELARLFGFLKTDEKTGEILEILSDYQDED